MSRAILLMAVAAFVSGANLRVADPLIPKLAETFATSVGTAAGVVTAFTLAYGLFQLIHGPLGDSVGKLRMVVLGLNVAGLACVGCALAPSLPVLSALRFVAGAGAAAIIPLSLAYIGDHVPYERRQATLGRFIGATLLGQVFGPLLGGALSEFVDWHEVFLVLGAIFFVVGLLLLPEARRAGAPRARSAFNPLRRYRDLARDPWVRVVLATVALEGFAFYGALAYLGAYLKDRFQLGYLLIGLIIAGFSVGGVIYSVLVKWLLARLGERGLAVGGGATMMLCFGGIALAPAWGASVPFFILIGLGFYMLHNTLQTRATEMAPKVRGSAVSFFAFCLFLGQATGVAVAGVAVERVGYVPMLLAAGAGILALSLWFRAQLAGHRTPHA
jgi:predicted MFS family arabinose efflux permease